MRNLRLNSGNVFRKMILKKFAIVIITIIVSLFPYSFQACSVESPFNDLEIKSNKKNEGYSFFIGGHLYEVLSNGNSMFSSPSISAVCEMINESTASFMVLLGDSFRSIIPITLINCTF